MLKEQATDRLKNFDHHRKSHLIRDYLTIVNNLPHHLEDATVDIPIDWIPTIPPTQGISPQA